MMYLLFLTHDICSGREAVTYCVPADGPSTTKESKTRDQKSIACMPDDLMNEGSRGEVSEQLADAFSRGAFFNGMV